MKKLVRLLSLVLVLLLAVCVFVACNDTPDDGPDNGDEPGEDDGGDTTQKFNVTFKFLDPKTDKELEPDIVRRNIAYNKEAYIPLGYENSPTRFADYVLIGWDSDGDEKPDDGYKHVKKNLTINAVFRAKETFTVKFYESANKFIELKVKEGDAVDASKAACSSSVGLIFKGWVNADEHNSTSLDCVREDASFVAQYVKINSVIPMVGKGTIEIDGKKDDAYKDAAYLPINEERHADREDNGFEKNVLTRPRDKDGEINGRKTSWITADAWLLWDGDYIYMLVEVSDKTLTYRNPLYVHGTYNAWLNDNIEAYFNFEQNPASDTNRKKLALDALSQKLFANTIAEYGYNSTHFSEMKGAARSALGYFKNGFIIDTAEAKDGLINDVASLKDTDDLGVQYADYDETEDGTKNYSYRIELGFVAKTEGVPDKVKFPEVDDNGRLPTGYELEDGTLVPAIDVKNTADRQNPAKTDMKFYRFTEGEKLQVGSMVRFALQINDLMLSLQDDMWNPNSGFYEGNPADEAQMREAMFYATDGKTTVSPPFVPTGHTQYSLSQYVAFSLGDENSKAQWEVYELKGTGYGEAKMIGADGKVIEQGKDIVTVEIAK